jgi:phosphoribosylamine--glycine ligase
MNVLIVGSGGREDALAWKVAQSPRCARLYVAPGNGGTAQRTRREELQVPQDPLALAYPQTRPHSGFRTLYDGPNVAIGAEDIPALVTFVRDQKIDLAIIGPELPLAAGLTDELCAVGVRVFGPSRAAAQIEASKAFAKAFMTRHGIPTARYAAFNDFYNAVGYLLGIDYPVVIKASGLAAGKGVILPTCLDEAEAALRQIMLEREFGAAGDEVVIEERLCGEEVSVLAFTDGVTVKPMPPAQDHKRLLDGDMGPNTGGMGAYAPAPICPPAFVEEIKRTILQPTVDGLRAEGRPFVGVLYAGLILTVEGPRVLEFNCRLGDPETQALLPLLDCDLLDIAEACVEGRLAEAEIHWKQGATACIVLAAEGYPGKYPKGREIHGLESAIENAIIFHAGTAKQDGKIVTAGGRVLNVTAWDDTLPGEIDRAYAAVEHLRFEGMQYRRDIGARALGTTR